MLFSAPESILIKTATCEVWQTALCASHTLSTALERRRGLDGFPEPTHFWEALKQHNLGLGIGANVSLRKFSSNYIILGFCNSMNGSQMSRTIVLQWLCYFSELMSQITFSLLTVP